MRLKSLFPSGACNGSTEKGKRCGIRDIFENGFCGHHGGEGQLIRFKLAALKTERLLKRTKALSQKIERRMQATPTGRVLLERMRARKNEKEKEDLRGTQQTGTPLPVQDAV